MLFIKPATKDLEIATLLHKLHSYTNQCPGIMKNPYKRSELSHSANGKKTKVKRRNFDERCSYSMGDADLRSHQRHGEKRSGKMSEREAPLAAIVRRARQGCGGDKYRDLHETLAAPLEFAFCNLEHESGFPLHQAHQAHPFLMGLCNEQGLL
ncbi:hypothetical protein EUGRSUZ_F00096 [Eucalyptus grandis]|uniref:Uncharacterized protein n=2 Tax=Eucalyptus grandis TaxID=71139 RepID=A0ACC3KCB4_EUCGR|nr:hypothetical protein EUGRSUZ_F00096 [Eucalyptus grandis]